MRRLLPPLAALLLLGPWATAPAAAASATLDRIKEKGAITFAYRDGAAPFSFKDRTGRVRGYSVELCTRAALAVQRELQLKELRIDWVPVDAATRFDTVASGRVDAECGTSTITLARMKTVDFSLPIFVDGGSVLVRARSKLARFKDLKGKRIAVIAGTTTEQGLARALSNADAPAILVPVKNGGEGMALLTQGKVDGYAGDRVVLAGFRMRSSSPDAYEVIGEDFSYEPYALVLPRNDADFRLAVNSALAGLYRTGDIDPIFQRWLGNLGKPGTLLHSMFYLNTLPE
ncbi:MAG TPA: amino acid ABC transporter substrate-binding protein [Gemmatimonadaceae bacterium]|nr:amino acid ABC transporter substrate-binding protein [Gemmatimonadaceae bacterium]